MFQQEKKYLEDGINADDAPFIVKASEMINAVNHRFGVSENGNVGYNQSLPGDMQVPYTYIAGTNIPIGSARDDKNRRFVYFIYNTAGFHGIYCYDIPANVIRPVLLDSQVRDGLKFNLVDRVNEAFVIDGKVYWCDPEPRCMNIEAGIKYNDVAYNTPVQPYAVGILQSTIRLIKKTQNLPLLVEKVISSTIPAIATYGLNLLIDAYQFFVRYTYREYERSVIGPYSKLIEYNYKDSSLNAVQITFNPAEAIDQDVQIIELGVRYNNIGNGFIIKQWDKSNPADLNDINSHNNGTPLKFYFLNNETGPAVDPLDLAKSFDSVPLTAKTPSLAKNRLFLGNGRFGYTSPTYTSLTVAISVFPDAGGTLGAWYSYVVTWDLPGSRHVTMPGVFIDLGSGAAKRYVFFSSIQFDYVESIFSDVGQVNTGFVAPASISNTLVTVQSASLADIDLQISKQYRNLTGTTTNLVHGTLTPLNKPVLITNNLTAGQARPFKSNSGIKAGIVFLDEDRRKCGVVTNDGLRKVFTNRTFAQIAFNNTLVWTLSNVDAITQIPDWAHYYSIVRTKSLTTNFFFQGNASDACYVTVDIDGKLSFSSFAVPVGGFDNTFYGIGIRLSEMKAFGIGYTFTKGDLANLYFPSPRVPIFGLPVIGQYSDWVILQRTPIGALDNTSQIIFEIYTPHQEAINEGYYEIGEIYEVSDPGLSSRFFSKTTGLLNGDVYAISRQSKLVSYVAEAMSPDDKNWQNWWTDVGWINIVDNIGQQQRTNSACWSNVLIPGTRSNGLSSFDALDIIDLPVESGQLNKLILSSKVQSEGSVMLAICANETLSLYLGETQVIDSSGNVSFTATSTTVIGTINVLKGSYGTKHTESVKEYRGNVYWWDVINGKIIQYSSNGLFPVTDYKMTKFFQKYARRYLELGSIFPMVGGIDPSTEEYLLSFTGLETTGYAATLPTLTNQNEFELYDGLSKTFAFKLGGQKFVSTYSYYSQLFEYIGVKFFTFSAGQLYKPGLGAVPDNLIHGVQGTTKLMFLANSNPFQIKRFSNIAVEANMPPLHAIFYTTNPYEQITDLYANDFRLKEGVYYAALYRDRLSPNTSGNADAKMYQGNKMIGPHLYCQLEFDTSVTPLQMKAVDIGYHKSEGHTV